MLRRHGRDARHAAAEIHPRRDDLPAHRRRQFRRQAAHRRGAGRRIAAPRRCSLPNRERTMDFSLSNEQRNWQMIARKFANEEIKPITLDLDEAPDAHGTFDWDIVEKGSKLGFRTMAVPKEYGGEGTDYVTQALVMAELARGDSAISQDLQPELEVEPPDLGGLQRRAEGALPAAVRRRSPLSARQGHHRADRRLRQPHAAEGRAQGRPQASRRAPGRRVDPERREMLHRQRAGRQAVLHRRPHRSERAAPPGHHHVPGRARHARISHRQGVQQERLAVLSQRRDDLRERPRAARQRGRPGQQLRHEDRRPPATAPAATCSAISNWPPTRSASATTPASRR